MGASSESRDFDTPRIVLILRRIGLLDAQSRMTLRATQLAATAQIFLRRKKQDGYEGQEFVHELGTELFKDDALLAECPEGDPEQLKWLKRQISNLVQRAFRAGHFDRMDVEASERIESAAKDTITPEQILTGLQMAERLHSLLKRHQEFAPIIEHADLRKNLPELAAKLGLSPPDLRRLLARFKDHFDRHVRDDSDIPSKGNHSDDGEPR